MGILQDPTDTVAKIVSLPRWQREWINSRKSINFSGLTQEIIIELMKVYDQDYYFEHECFIESRIINRKDVIKNAISKHPSIIPKIT